MPSADGGDLMRQLLATILQLLVDAEATAYIGAKRHERSSVRTTQRNGTREKLVATATGDITVKIPKVRQGSFFPSLLTPRRRIDVALLAVIAQAWVGGCQRATSTTWSPRSGTSPASPSPSVADLRATRCRGHAWRSRELDEQAMPYVSLDATYCKARINDRVESRAVVITDVTADGRREVLGCDVGDSEAEDFWTEFLRSLRERGLHGVQLVISDAHRGLVNAVTAVCAGAGGNAARSTS